MSELPFPHQVINIPPPAALPGRRSDRWLSALQRVVFVAGAVVLLWQLAVYLKVNVASVWDVVGTYFPTTAAPSQKGYFRYVVAAGPIVPPDGKVVMLNRKLPRPFSRLREHDRLRAVTSLHLHATDDADDDSIVVRAGTCLEIIAKVRPLITAPRGKKSATSGWLYLQVIPCS